MPYSQIGRVDLVVSVSADDERAQAIRAAEVVFAASLFHGSRVYLDPLVDLDRTSDASLGLLDRLSNPRRAFHVVRCLNTILFSSGGRFDPIGERTLGGGRALGIVNGVHRFWLCLPARTVWSDRAGIGELDGSGNGGTLFDLSQATSRPLPPRDSGASPGPIELRAPMLLMLPLEPPRRPVSGARHLEPGLRER
jgi:hypothetical protein